MTVLPNIGVVISSSQLSAWTAQGSVQAARDTYHSVLNALATALTSVSGSAYTVYLQGSYGNDTNVRADSDVDIVAEYRFTYTNDYSALGPAEQAVQEAFRRPATYTLGQWRNDLTTALRRYYGYDRVAGRNKCIEVAGDGHRLRADVLPALSHRAYRPGGTAIEGVSLQDVSTGELIVNYPKQTVVV